MAMAPVAGIPQMASEPWPSCQARSSAPARSTKVITATAASISGKLPYRLAVASMARAPLPPTLVPPSSAAARSRTRSTVASPASVLVSATGRTLTRAVPSRRQAGPAGAAASCTPSTASRRAAAREESVPAGTRTSMGGRTPLATRPPPAGQGPGRPVQAGANGGQDDRQQGEGGQGDEQAGVADAAQERHRQQDQGEQAHRDPQADQGDQELDDEAALDQPGEPEHGQEGGEDGHGGDQQRHQGQEGAEHEGQHDQGAEAAGEGLDQHAGAGRLLGGRRPQGVQAGHLDAGAGREGPAEAVGQGGGQGRVGALGSLEGIQTSP